MQIPFIALTSVRALRIIGYIHILMNNPIDDDLPLLLLSGIRSTIRRVIRFALPLWAFRRADAAEVVGKYLPLPQVYGGLAFGRAGYLLLELLD